MPFSHHVVPIDILEAIIDQASDHRRSLKAISLTSLILLPRARYHLFHRIVIKSSEQMRSVPAFLQARPWLLPLVRIVAFDPDWENSRYPYGIVEVVPVPLLTQLPNLCRFDVNPTFHRSSLSLSRRTLCAFRTCSASVQHIELHGVIFSTVGDLMRYLSAFPNLSRLACDDVPLEKAEVPLRADVLSNKNLKLTYLMVRSPSM